MKFKILKFIAIILLSLVLLGGCDSKGNNAGDEKGNSTTEEKGNNGDKKDIEVETKKYKCIFKNEDGTILEEYNDVEKPSADLFTGSTPLKKSTKEFYYDFSGWVENKNDLVIEYTPSFIENYKFYTITFKNDNGEILSEMTYTYGSYPNSLIETYKEPTEENEYIFAGWSPQISQVEDNQTYVAKYNSVKRKYLVSFCDQFGNVYSSQEYTYGETPKCTNTPTKESDRPGNYYVFKEWSPTVTTVTGNTTYFPVFEEKKKLITIYFKTDEGTVSQKVEYGDAPTYDVTPTKEPTNTVEYQFLGWEPSISASVYSTTTYTPIFIEQTRKYTVTLLDDNDTIINKLLYEYNEAFNEYVPYKDDGVGCYYVGKWSPEITTVTEDITIKATYEKKNFSYNVAYVDGNDSCIKTLVLEYGSDIPEVIDVVPTKNSTENHEYVFDKWDIKDKVVTKDTVIYPLFTEYSKYAFKFVDGKTEQKTILSSDNILDYCPENSKESFDENTKVLSNYIGWNKTSEYVVEEIKYTITFHDSVGTNLYKYEDNGISLLNIEKQGYTFIGWYSENLYTNKLELINNLTSNYDLYAKFEINVYNIQYEFNGGSCSESNISSYEAFSLQYIENNPVKEGYNFVCWSYDFEGKNSLEKLSNGKSKFINKCENLTLYANYSPIISNIYFDADGGEFELQYITVFYHYFNKVEIKEFDASKPIDVSSYNCGYGLVGWYIDSELTTGIYDDMSVYDGMHLYAKTTDIPKNEPALNDAYFQVDDPKFKDCVYGYSNYYHTVGYANKVEFTFVARLNKGNNYNECSVNVYNYSTGTSYIYYLYINEKYDTKYIEQTFVCNSGNLIYISISLDGTGTNCWFKVKDVRSVSIIGTLDKSKTHMEATYDSVINNIPIPTKEGYEFAGWYDENDVLFDFSKTYKYYTDVKLKAKWNEI